MDTPHDVLIVDGIPHHVVMAPEAKAFIAAKAAALGVSPSVLMDGVLVSFAHDWPKP